MTRGLNIPAMAKRAVELRAEAQRIDDDITAIRADALATALKENAELRARLAEQERA